MTQSKDSLGDRMKVYEGMYTGYRVPFDQYLIVRLDGNGFSKYTKPFDRVFDERIWLAMTTTTTALVDYTNAILGYTQSDEITLVFGKTEKQFEHLYGGKISKLNSILASFASTKFNASIDHPKGKEAPLAIFDARAFGVPTAGEVANNVLWRIQDCRRNSVSSLFRWTAGHKKMQGLSSTSMIEILRDEYGVNWEDQPEIFRFGTFVRSDPSRLCGQSYVSAKNYLLSTFEEQEEYVTNRFIDTKPKEGQAEKSPYYPISGDV